MSWSFSGVGTAKALRQAIDRDLARYTAGVSRDEFAAAVPHLQGLLAQADTKAAVALSASGHGSYNAQGVKTYAQIAVDLKQIGTLVVEEPSA